MADDKNSESGTEDGKPPLPPTLGHPASTNPNVSTPAALAGDTVRRADDSGRGMIYQYWQTVDRWLAIKPNEKLYVEGAEDIDLVSGSSATATSVRDTVGSGGISLGSAKIIKSLCNFFDIRKANGGFTVRFQYLTTSGTRAEHGFGGEHAVDVWMDCHTTEHIVALGYADRIRTLLLKHADLSEPFKEFLKKKPLTEILGFIRSVEWLTHRPDLAELKTLVVNKLHAANGRLTQQTASTVANTLYQLVNDAAVKKTATALSYEELHGTIERTTHVEVPADQFSSMLSALTAKAFGTAPDVSFSLATRYGLPISPPGLHSRTVEIQKIQQRLHTGILSVWGPMGMGKTQLIRQAIGTNNGIVWGAFRDKQRLDVDQALLEIASLANNIDNPIVVLDDLNEAQSLSSEYLLSVLRSIVAQKNGAMIVAAYKPVPGKVAAALGLQPGNQLEVPDFIEDDIKAILTERGCPTGLIPSTAKVVWLQTFGHPQLVDARVKAIHHAEFPPPDSSELFNVPSDVKAEREAARTTMRNTLPGNARELLVRLSVTLGRFTRANALRVAALDPPIPDSGDALDLLTGPWLERVDEEKLSVSPLAKDLATETLTPERVKELHARYAEILVADRIIDQDIFSASIVHAMAGENETMAALLGRIYLMANPDVQPLLANAVSWIPVVGVVEPERLPFKTQFARSFFRLMQWKIASYANIEALSALEAVIESELPPPGTPIEAQSPRIIYLTQRLLAIELPLDPGKAVDIFLELRRLLGEFNAAFPDSKLLDDEAPPMTPAIKRDTILDLFSVAVVPRVKSPAALRNLTLKLAELPDETREYLLSAFSTDDGELRLVMRSPHIAVSHVDATRDDFEAALRLAIQHGQAWNHVPWIRASMRALAELLNDTPTRTGEAKIILSDAISTYGRTHALTDMEATISFIASDYEQALKIYNELLPVWDAVEKYRDMQPMYAQRFAAISASHLEKFDVAEAHFRGAIEKARFFKQVEFIIGLRADLAFALWREGQLSESLAEFRAVCITLETMDISKSQPTAFALNKFVSHTLIWLAHPTHPRERPPGLCSDAVNRLDIVDLPPSPLELSWLNLMALADKAADEFIQRDAAERIEHSPIAVFRAAALKFLIEDSLSSGDLRHLIRRAAALAVSRTILESQRDAPVEVLAAPDGENLVEVTQDVYLGTVVAAFVFGILAARRAEADIDTLLAEWQKNVPEKDAFTVAALSRVVEIRNASADEINRLVCTGNGHDSLYAAALAPEREGTSPAVELYAHLRIVEAFGPRRIGFDTSPADLNELMRRFWRSTDKLYPALLECEQIDVGWPTSARILIAGFAGVPLELPDSMVQALVNLANFPSPLGAPSPST